jgi:hypothetical protein
LEVETEKLWREVLNLSNFLSDKMNKGHCNLSFKSRDSPFIYEQNTNRLLTPYFHGKNQSNLFGGMNYSDNAFKSNILSNENYPPYVLSTNYMEIIRNPVVFQCNNISYFNQNPNILFQNFTNESENNFKNVDKNTFSPMHLNKSINIHNRDLQNYNVHINQTENVKNSKLSNNKIDKIDKINRIGKIDCSKTAGKLQVPTLSFKKYVPKKVNLANVDKEKKKPGEILTDQLQDSNSSSYVPNVCPVYLPQTQPGLYICEYVFILYKLCSYNIFLLLLLLLLLFLFRDLSELSRKDR